MIYEKDWDNFKALEGLTQVILPQDEFYKFLLKWLSNQEIKYLDDETLGLIKNQALDIDEMANAYNIWNEIQSDELIYIANQSLGDGSDMEWIYAIKVDKGMYVLLRCIGTYSSWGEDEWYNIEQITLTETTCLKSEIIGD